uniref:Uncharacterized protein n=1 Tax=Oryza rufipogon TaxID=4529 RepID=A0A0E0RI25_ORYRU
MGRGRLEQQIFQLHMPPILDRQKKTSIPRLAFFLVWWGSPPLPARSFLATIVVPVSPPLLRNQRSSSSCVPLVTRLKPHRFFTVKVQEIGFLISRKNEL